MTRIEPEFVGTTFDDFLFRPQRGIVSRRGQVDLSLRVSVRHSLSLPILSANMDSITRAPMAKTMALEGGVGIIHRAMPIAEQAREVSLVKRSHGYLVERPLFLPLTATLREARQFTRQHNITGILIEDAPGSNRLAGLLSNRDMPWSDGQEDRPVSEFMTPRERLVTATPGVSTSDAEKLLFVNRIEKLPLIGADGDVRGLITKKDLILSRQRPYSSKDGKGRLLVGAAIGARGDFIERALELVKAGTDILVIDIAHGHSDVMRAAVESFRKHLGDRELICGNVGTGEGALFLKELGVDGIKVGIGPGRGLQDTPGNRRRRCAVAGDPGGMAGGRRVDPDRSRRGHSTRQGHLSRPCLRRVLGHAGGNALRDGRGPRRGDRRSRHGAETQDLSGYDLPAGRSAGLVRRRGRGCGRGARDTRRRPGDADPLPGERHRRAAPDPRAPGIFGQLRRGHVVGGGPRENSVQPPSSIFRPFRKAPEENRTTVSFESVRLRFG